MKLGISTIQRDRAKWLTEWVVFHHLVGFTNFYIYLHKCRDNSKEVVANLQKHFNIQCFEVADDTDRPQLVSYHHAYQEYGHEIDWMAFIDGDEFLYPSTTNHIGDVLEKFNYQKISALAVYWQCFGSSGHIQDPNGLIIEDYQYRAKLAFLPNRHIKSIVRGRQGQNCTSAGNAHIFNTIYGTYDEQLRPINSGWMKELEPSYTQLRINHYACQSYEFFKNFKKSSGAADVNVNHIRPDTWWDEYNNNDEHDNTILKYTPSIKNTLNSITHQDIYEPNTRN